VALNCQVGTVTQPGSTGNQTISLPANFDPKAIIMWGSPLTAAGVIANSTFGWGFGTYRGSVVQQRCFGLYSADAAATQNGASRGQSDALFVLMSGGTGTLDLEIDLVSMSVGATSNVIINWTNLHTTGSILLNYMILGGSDITDALVMSVSTTPSVATQDITVVAGFGQPDLVMCFTPSMSFSTSAQQWILPSFGIGFDDNGTIRNRYLAYAEDEGNTTMAVAVRHKAGLGAGISETAGLDFEFHLSAKTDWPTDGFEITYDDQTAFSDAIGILALKGTFTRSLSTAANPSATGNQTYSHIGPPSAFFMFGANIATIAGTDTTNSSLIAVGMGGGDGTNEGCAGWTNDDALGTSDNNSFFSNAKVWQTYSQAAALLAEGDHSFSGSDVIINWNDADATAREFSYLILGSEVAFVPRIMRQVN